MLRVFMAPQTESGYLTLQAQEGTWHAAIVALEQRGEQKIAELVRSDLARQGARVPRPIRQPEANTGPSLRVRLPDDDARTVLRTAGVSA